MKQMEKEINVMVVVIILNLKENILIEKEKIIMMIIK